MRSEEDKLQEMFESFARIAESGDLFVTAQVNASAIGSEELVPWWVIASWTEGGSVVAYGVAKSSEKGREVADRAAELFKKGIARARSTAPVGVVH